MNFNNVFSCLGAPGLWENRAWDWADCSKGRRKHDKRHSGNWKNFCEIGWQERFSRGGKAKQEQNQRNCWGSEIGIRLEDSQRHRVRDTGVKLKLGMIQQNYALLIWGRLAASPKAWICYFSTLLCSEKHLSSEPLPCTQVAAGSSDCSKTIVSGPSHWGELAVWTPLMRTLWTPIYLASAWSWSCVFLCRG